MSTSKRQHPQFTLHLEAQHRWDDADGMRRLRAVLKVLLRSFGFRCKSIDYPAAADAPPIEHSIHRAATIRPSTQ